MVKIPLMIFGMVVAACCIPFVAVAQSLSTMVAPKDVAPLPDTGWTLVWADEFEGPSLDRTKWAVEEACWGGGNDERQCYTDWAKTVAVQEGVLQLAAMRQTVTGPKYPLDHPDWTQDKATQKYISGKVTTRGLASWKYGRFAARIKLPKGQGTWPAFWMLPATNAYGDWAASGEIDIMEAVNLGARCTECLGNNGENRSSGALHFGGKWPDNTFLFAHHPLPGGVDAADQYHVFAVEWGEGRIDWFVDDEKFFTLEAQDWHSSKVDKAESPYAPFDQDFYLILNLAVGGKLSERNNAKGVKARSFPAQLHIDWVRVYQCSQDQDTGRACMQQPQ